MKRFFLLPLLLFMLLAAGCTCSMRGSATIPSRAPTAAPTMKATAIPVMTPSAAPTQPTETVAPVEPTPQPSASATAGN